LAMPELLLPTIGTIVLIASSLPMHIADQGIRDGHQRRLKIGYIIAFVLALVFLGIKYLEYFGIPNTSFTGAPYTVSTHAYGSMVWTLIGYHSLHMLVLL